VDEISYEAAKDKTKYITDLITELDQRVDPGYVLDVIKQQALESRLHWKSFDFNTIP
jgi:hypothetical protein